MSHEPSLTVLRENLLYVFAQDEPGNLIAVRVDTATGLATLMDTPGATGLDGRPVTLELLENLSTELARVMADPAAALAAVRARP
jgi:hypothetical protein